MAVHRFTSSRLMLTEESLSSLTLGDRVLLKSWENKHPRDQLLPQWEGPHEVLLVAQI